MHILAIETSCDETSIAILEADKNGRFKILSNIVSSQIKIHAPYGGVVPMLAKREHQRNLPLILKRALNESRLLKISNFQFPISKQIPNFKIQMLKKILEREDILLKKLLPFLKKYQKPNINLIAVTNGPGLEPALWVGVNFAKALGLAWALPVMPINHVEAHIIANWLPHSVIPAKAVIQKTWMPDQVRHDKKTLFPAICLIASGGHTQLVLMRGFGKYKILGETRDDAAGEAFDKLAKMLNLGYPGGPIVSKLATRHSERSEESPAHAGQISPDKLGDSSVASLSQNDKIRLPRPMLNSKDYDFSFSGLKTAALYFVKTLDKKTLKKLTPAICAEFQQAVVDVLVAKTIRAATQLNGAKEFKVKSVLLSGGVAANDLLRETLKKEAEKNGLHFHTPPKNFCTDNAAMIALTTYLKTKKLKQKTGNWKQIKVDANLRLE